MILYDAGGRRSESTLRYSIPQELRDKEPGDWGGGQNMILCDMGV